MRFALGVGLLLLASMAVIAVENGQVMYVGGTVSGVNEGVLGKLDFVSETSLIFAETGGSKLAIPFAKMESYEYSNEVAHHLGVLPAIGVGLVKKRQRKHFFRISFRDEKMFPRWQFLKFRNTCRRVCWRCCSYERRKVASSQISGA